MSKKTKTKQDDFFTNREDLKDHIHDIHNFIRNNGAGYGQTGMKIFSIFYGLKLIQPFLDELKISKQQKEDLKFDNLLSKSENDIVTHIDKNILNTLSNLRNSTDKKISDIGRFLFYEIPKNLKGEFWIELIGKIKVIPVGYTDGKVNLSGKVYEYFVGRDKTAISEMGAYFTDRHITEFLLNKINPQLDEKNNIPTMIDPFGGSGGFTLGYANYLRENFSEIDWTKNVDNIYHFDMEENVVNMTGLEMFAITNVLPKINDFNYKRVNSFSHEFPTNKESYQKYDCVISNPPYGGDKLNESAKEKRRKETINHLKTIFGADELKENKQYKCLVEESKKYKEDNDHKVTLSICSKRINEFAKKFNIEEKKANDKEACSLILLMDLVEKNGLCCAVLKEGVFFDNSYSELRKVLIDNFNVTDIVSIPQTAFEGTNTKTSAIIFYNNGKTKKIKFTELVVEKAKENIFEIDDKGWYQLLTTKGEITKVYEKLKSTVKYSELNEPTLIKNKKGEEIERFDYSLDYKKYLKEDTFCPEGYELKKIGDYLEFKPKSKRAASFANETGKFKFYTSSDKIKKCDECDFKDEQLKIIFGTGGTGSLFLNNKFSCSADNLVCTTKDDKLSEYIFNYIQNNWNNFTYRLFNGSTLGHINKDGLSNYQIPIPKDLNKLKSQLDKVQKLHKQISDDTELIPQKEKEICELIKKMISEGKKGVDYEEYKLGDLCIVKAGPYVKNYESGNIPIIGGGEVSNYTNKFSHENDWVIHKDGVSDKIISFIKGQFLLNHHGWCMNINEKVKNIVSKNYIGYYIKMNTQEYLFTLNGSNQKGLNQETFYNFKIKVPTSSTMKKYNFEKLFNEVDQIKERLEATKKEHEKEVKVLMKPFENNTDIKEIQIDNSEITTTIKKKSSKKNNESIDN